MQAELRAGQLVPGLSPSVLDGPDGGKMFGVLVVALPDGRFGFIRAFSGMLGGKWEHAGFVPPLFDAQARARVELPGEATVKALIARAEAHRTSPEHRALCAESAGLDARHAAERATLREQHEARRRERHARRAELTPRLTEPARSAALHSLDQESRGDKAERRRVEARHEEERANIVPRARRSERRLRALERLRRIVCRELMRRIHDSYRVRNARGQVRPLRELYLPGEPPSGAADCAAPKLLAHAFAEGLRPVALAEFWWGAPPSAGGRASGAYYAACRDKCGPLLPFMLEGLCVARPRAFIPPVHPPTPLDIVYEDAAVVVLDKPAGLLSVPGRDSALTDSVLTRLRERHPSAAGPLLVHRLDLDTSGLLVAGLQAQAHAELQRQFTLREVTKRYIAWVAGSVQGEHGVIDFPMRVDLADRPRQIHDPVHGKPALTRWQVLERQPARTRVAFFPLTGRTHQLRVHAAHPLGLGAPIVGDRLYGHADARLFLHAEALSFRHPVTGERLDFERPAPF
ncbi:RluA family pseudouridine synthase [Corallococcus sp. H22C18031201]|nr:RluA family pseudouridine synthase [Corallococcus sp. H22C18031201]